MNRTALALADLTGDPAGAELLLQPPDPEGNQVENVRGLHILVIAPPAEDVEVTFEADLFGVQQPVLTRTVPAGRPRIFGPFRGDLFGDHSVTEPEAQGRVFVRCSSDKAQLAPFISNGAIAG